MQKRKGLFRSMRIYLFGAFSLIFLSIVFFAAGPNRELYFLREVPSTLSPDRIDRNFSALNRWPQWFFSTASVVANSDSNPQLQKGTLLTLQMDPRKGEQKKFVLTAEVTDYEPGNSLGLKIISDSSGRLTRLFDDIRWNIHILPKAQGSLIRAEARARTKHWRSRVFGQISEKILMNQTFYPNVLKLSQLKQPFSLEQTSQSAGLFSP